MREQIKTGGTMMSGSTVEEVGDEEEEAEKEDEEEGEETIGDKMEEREE